MSQRTLKLHRALSMACIGFVASMAGCLGDDSTAAPDAAADRVASGGDTGSTSETSTPRPDSSTPDTSMTAPDAGSDVSVRETGGPDAVPDGGARDGAPDVVTADARDATPEAARESSAPETGAPDVVADRTEASAPEAAGPETSAPEAGDAADTALHLCTVLDQDVGDSTDAAACIDMTDGSCPDRTSNWALPFVGVYGMSPGGVFDDCRINGMFATLDNNARVNYGNDLASWALSFFGCPFTGSPPLDFGLVPAPLAGNQFTSADLQALSEDWVAAVDTVLGPDQGIGTPLTTQQHDQVSAQLAALAARFPNRVPSNALSYSTCSSDAGGQ